MTARKHHYIPRCYLKGFAEDRDKPRLFVIDAKTRKSFPAVPSDIAAERDFHKIAVDGLAPDALENSFSGFEGELSQALQRLITARSFKDATDRALLFNLIGLISVKNPSHRENIRDTHEHIAKIILQLATQTPERWQIQQQKAKEDGVVDDNGPTYEEMRDFAQGENCKINVSTGYLLELELKSFDAILPYIFARKWVVVKATPKTTGFVTSDRPICLMWSDPAQRGGFHRPGHGRRGTQIVFPVSNELTIIGAFEARDGEIDANDLLIAKINGTIIAHANCQVYARDSNFIYIMQHNKEIMHGDGLLEDQCSLSGKS